MFGTIGLPAGGQLEHAVIRRDDWTRCATGLNDFGQLGDGSTTDSGFYFCDTNLVGTTLLMEDPNTTARLFWEPSADASSYRVYLGVRLAGAPWAYNHSCLTPAGVFVPETTHFASPAGGGDLYYYLIAARTACGETHVGRDSGYAVRPKPSPCP
jgi:hypothetical protein